MEDDKKKDFKIKFKEVYLPFLLSCLIIFAGYNFLIWVFEVKLGILRVDDLWTGYLFPVIITGVVILFYLRKRIKILNLKGEKEGRDFYDLYSFLMAVFIVLPTIVGYNYISKASYNLTEVEKVRDIKNYPDERFFKIRSYDVIRQASPFYPTHTWNDNHLRFYVYFSCPFNENSPGDFVWFGVEYFHDYGGKYHKAHNDSEEDMNKAMNEFIDNSIISFEKYDFYNLDYFERIGPSDDYDNYIAAITEHLPEFKDDNHIILVPKQGDFGARTGESLGWMLFWLGFGNLLIFLLVIAVRVDKDALKRIESNEPLEDSWLKDILPFINPFGPHKVTAAVTDINIIIYVLMLILGVDFINPTAQDLIEFGGNRRGEVLNGEVWRLFTSMFVHGGLKHIAYNLMGLVICGIFLEPFMNSKRFFVAYVVSGLCASIASIYWYENTVSVGASGAIFGLYGVLLSFAMFSVYSKGMSKFIWSLIGTHAGLGLLFGFLSPGIDNAAHIGGLLTGLVIGAIMSSKVKEELQGESEGTHM